MMKVSELEGDIMVELLPKDQNDTRDIILEVRGSAICALILCANILDDGSPFSERGAGIILLMLPSDPAMC